MKNNDNDKNVSYNDDMPINAVGKLIDNSIKNEKTTPQIKSNFVRGFESEQEDVKQNRLPQRRPLPTLNEGINERKASNLNNITEINRGNEENATTTKLNEYNAVNPQRRAGIGSSEREQRKRMLSGMDLDSPKNISLDKIPQNAITPKQQRPQRSTPYKTNKPAQDPFTSKRDSRFLVFKIAGFSVFFVTIIIMAFLVWQINSLQNQLAIYQETIESIPTAEAMEAMAQQEVQLRAQISSLNDDIYHLNNILAGNVLANVTPSDNVLDDATTQETSDNVHIVQPGDSLSTIAQNLLGSTAYVNLIMEANNLTGTNLGIGQSLIIPTLP